jgi:hypothetical protein
VAKEIEHLPSKCKALSSNPVPLKKKKKKNPIFAYLANCPSKIREKLTHCQINPEKQKLREFITTGPVL